MARNTELRPKFPGLRAERLIRAGKHDEAVAELKAHLAATPDDHAAWQLLAQAETQRREHFAALKAIRRAIALAPDEIRYRRYVGLALSNLGRFDEASALLEPIVEAHPEDYFALHALQIVHCKAGNESRAVELGGRILAIEDRAAIARPLPDPNPAQAALSRRRGRKVIAYALWGANPVYCYGAMINARISAFIFPDWKCRFYLGSDVPKSVRSLLERAGAELVDAAERYPDVSPAMWRFLVADDPSVAVFLCRDCDARLGVKEAAAVDSWLRGGMQCHVMRDHVLHRNLMLAGMWGARTNPPLRVHDRMKRFLRAGADVRYGIDQRFLALEIWPAIRQSCLVHDSYYSMPGAHPFPIMGKGNDRSHVGNGIKGEERLKQEAELLGLPWPISEL